MKKRNLFDEISSGIADMQAHRQRKVTLRTTKLVAPPVPHLRTGEIRKVRENLGVSQSVFAYMLRVNPRTLQRWEQGQNKPNDQAVVLIKLVEEHPEVLRHLEALST
jgi:putative transcriptional regulator